MACCGQSAEAAQVLFTNIDTWHNRTGAVGQASAVDREKAAIREGRVGAAVKEVLHSRGKAAMDVPASGAAATYQLARALIFAPIKLGTAAYQAATGDRESARATAAEGGKLLGRPFLQALGAVTSLGGVLLPEATTLLAERLQRLTTNLGSPERAAERLNEVMTNHTVSWDADKLKWVVVPNGPDGPGDAEVQPLEIESQ